MPSHYSWGTTTRLANNRLELGWPRATGNGPTVLDRNKGTSSAPFPFHGSLKAARIISIVEGDRLLGHLTSAQRGRVLCLSDLASKQRS